jgi:hypothetical protein
VIWGPYLETPLSDGSEMKVRLAVERSTVRISEERYRYRMYCIIKVSKELRAKFNVHCNEEWCPRIKSKSVFCRAQYKIFGFKGSRRERGGVKKVANDRNWPQTAAIEVCLPYNLAVVFDFIYFRFRPNKEK